MSNSDQSLRIEKVTLAEATEALIKRFDIHDGMFELGVMFQMGAGSFVPPGSTEPYPSVITNIVGFELRQVPAEFADGPHIVDAAKVNPVDRA